MLHHTCCLSLASTLPWRVQGKTLTNSVKQIFTDFQTAVEKFQKLNYDAMNVDATQFTDDFATFCGVIRELERRLGAVIAQVHVLQLAVSDASGCVCLQLAVAHADITPGVAIQAILVTSTPSLAACTLPA